MRTHKNPQYKNIKKITSKRREKKNEEIGGYQGQDPTFFGDWQHKGKVSDF